MAETSFKDRDAAKKQLSTCGNWSAICVSLAFLLILIGIIWRLLNLDYYDLDSTFWFLLGIFFAIISIAPQIHIASIRHQLGFDSEHK